MEIRGRGLLVGIEMRVKARPFCERLKELGMLCKETHDTTIRLAPPLVIAREDLGVGGRAAGVVLGSQETRELVLISIRTSLESRRS